MTKLERRQKEAKKRKKDPTAKNYRVAIAVIRCLYTLSLRKNGERRGEKEEKKKMKKKGGFVLKNVGEISFPPKPKKKEKAGPAHPPSQFPLSCISHLIFTIQHLGSSFLFVSISLLITFSSSFFPTSKIFIV